jgi:hypothetical protein
VSNDEPFLSNASQPKEEEIDLNSVACFGGEKCIIWVWKDVFYNFLFIIEGGMLLGVLFPLFVFGIFFLMVKKKIKFKCPKLCCKVGKICNLPIKIFKIDKIENFPRKLSQNSIKKIEVFFFLKYCMIQPCITVRQVKIKVVPF